MLQETLVFDGTIAENVGWGKLGATFEEITQAAVAADAHDFIMRLPDGYDTRIGQRGRLLSGGQRQRIAIARALIRDAPVLPTRLRGRAITVMAVTRSRSHG